MWTPIIPAGGNYEIIIKYEIPSWTNLATITYAMEKIQL